MTKLEIEGHLQTRIAGIETQAANDRRRGAGIEGRGANAQEAKELHLIFAEIYRRKPNRDVTAAGFYANRIESSHGK